MALPLVPTDTQPGQERQHRTQIATTTNELVRLRQPNDKTSAESAAGIIPRDFRYPPGDVRRYGAVGDDSTDNLDAFTSALAVAAANVVGAIETPNRIVFPEGVYRISDSLNWYVRGLTIQAIGRVVIKSTASSGYVMRVDAGSLLNGYDFQMLGNFVLDTTNAGVGTGLYTRNVNHSTFCASIRNVVSAGCVIEGAVLSTYNIYVTGTHGGTFTTTPVNGITIDGSPACTQVTDCYFNLTIESCSDFGIVLIKCGACLFYGTSEGPPVSGGVQIGSGTFNFDNLFIGFFLEGTPRLGSLDCSGTGNRFINCFANTTPYLADFSAAPVAGATSGTLTANWTHDTGPHTIAFTDTATGLIEIRTVTLTNGSASATWTGGLAANCNARITTVVVLFRNGSERNDWNGTCYSAHVMQGALNTSFWNFASLDQIYDSGTATTVFGRQPNVSGNILPAKINIQDSWSNATYSGAWTNTSGTYNRLQYTKNYSTNEILLRGEAGGGVAGTVITVLPAGYRPSKSYSFPLAGNAANNFATVTVDTAGNVTHNGAGYTTSLDLSPVRFFLG